MKRTILFSMFISLFFSVQAQKKEATYMKVDKEEFLKIYNEQFNDAFGKNVTTFNTQKFTIDAIVEKVFDKYKNKVEKDRYAICKDTIKVLNDSVKRYKTKLGKSIDKSLHNDEIRRLNGVIDSLKESIAKDYVLKSEYNRKDSLLTATNNTLQGYINDKKLKELSDTIAGMKIEIENLKNDTLRIYKQYLDAYTSLETTRNDLAKANSMLGGYTKAEEDVKMAYNRCKGLSLKGNKAVFNENHKIVENYRVLVKSLQVEQPAEIERYCKSIETMHVATVNVDKAINAMKNKYDVKLALDMKIDETLLSDAQKTEYKEVKSAIEEWGDANETLYSILAYTLAEGYGSIPEEGIKNMAIEAIANRIGGDKFNDYHVYLNSLLGEIKAKINDFKKNGLNEEDKFGEFINEYKRKVK